MAEKRKKWNGLISGFSASDLVFLDESGCNTDMTRRYAYSFGGSRAVDATPLSKPKNTTVLSSIQLNGTLHYTTFSGGTTVERFKRYLETDLLPHLNGNSVLVMDNMKSHHAKAVKELLDSSGIRYIYLPPYSPDLNPIEKLWSKVKLFCANSKQGHWMLFQTHSNTPFIMFLLLTVPVGFVHAAMRFNFENCYKDNLVSLRKIHGYSQDELAEKIGVTRQTLSKYETGESLPDIERCKQLAEIFGVSMDDLVNYEKTDRENLGLEVPPKGKHVFGMVKVGDKGQIVIPANARKIFDIQPGDNLLILGDEEQGIAILKEKSFLEHLRLMERLRHMESGE